MADDRFESPVDLSDPPGAAAPLRWTATGLGVAALFLLGTNSIALKTWVDEQTPGPLQSRAATMATDWHARMTALGLAAPRAALNHLWLERLALNKSQHRPAPARQRSPPLLPNRRRGHPIGWLGRGRGPVLI